MSQLESRSPPDAEVSGGAILGTIEALGEEIRPLLKDHAGGESSTFYLTW